MRRWTPLVLAVALGGRAAAQTAIDGTLVNGTTGGPGRADRINLMQMSGGPNTIATLTGVEGSFHFDLKAPGPYLVQAHYQGATYNAQIPPQERGVATPAITVYDSTTDATALHVQLPHWIVIVDGPRVNVSRLFEIHNDSNPPVTVVGDPGVFRFDLPDKAESVTGNVSAGRMPIRQDPVETRDGKGQTVAYPMRPGTTTYQIDYELPYPGSIEIRETLYHGAATVTAIILPAGVTVESDGLEARGEAEREGIRFLTFAASNVAPGQTLTLRIRGDAVAPRPPGTAQGGDAGSSEGGAPALGGEPQKVPPAAVRGWRGPAVIGAVSTLLLLGLGIGLAAPAHPAGAETARRRTTAKSESLLAEMARLDDRHASGEVQATEHAEARARLRQALLEELDAARRGKPTA